MDNVKSWRVRIPALLNVRHQVEPFSLNNVSSGEPQKDEVFMQTALYFYPIN